MSRTPLLLLALAGVTLSACGKDGVRTVTVRTPGANAGTSSTPNATRTNSTPGDRATTPNAEPPGTQASARERARAYVRAVNLRSDDVPGFTPGDEHDRSSTREKRLESEMANCAGTPGVRPPGGAGAGEHKALAEQGSKDFQLKHGIVDFSVSSQVSVQPNASYAREALRAIRSAHVRECFSRYLRLLFKGERLAGARVGPVTIQAGVPPAPGTTGGFGWRITASFYVRGIKVPVYLDFLGFVNGPAEVTLLSSGLIRPFPAEVQQQLFSLLLSRAKGHDL